MGGAQMPGSVSLAGIGKFVGRQRADAASKKTRHSAGSINSGGRAQRKSLQALSRHSIDLLQQSKTWRRNSLRARQAYSAVMQGKAFRPHVKPSAPPPSTPPNASTAASRGALLSKMRNDFQEELQSSLREKGISLDSALGVNASGAASLKLESHEFRLACKLTAFETAAIYAYTSDAYTQLNGELRHYAQSDEQTEAFHTAIESGLKKLPAPEEREISRYVKVTDEMARKFVRGESLGMNILEPGYLSATAGADKIESVGETDLKLVIKLAPETRGRKIHKFSGFPQEDEVLFPRDSRFKVANIDYEKNEIVLEETHDGASGDIKMGGVWNQGMAAWNQAKKDAPLKGMDLSEMLLIKV